MTNDTLHWGIIGLGRFGRIHADVIRSLPGCELVAVSNRDPDKLRSAQDELGIKRGYQDYHQLLADSQIDVVTVVTHWRDHLQPALATLSAGKHLLLEKPMAASSHECTQLITAASQASEQIAMVGHICRFDPRISLAREAVASGRIGQVVSMHAKRNLPLAPGHIRLDKISPLMGDGIHDIDLMMWLTQSKPTRVFGKYVRFGEYRYPEVGWALLEFANECVGVVETNWGLPVNTPTVIDARLEVVGTAGQLVVDCAETGLIVTDADGTRAMDTVYWPKQHGQRIGALRHEIAYFVECIRTGTAPTVITLEESARAVAVVEAAEQSAESGQPVPMVGLG